ncbi:hypothetical protein MMC18_003376 [Xylographa bjoerkii]|nr:hypothetical protein [Xylographa bjoerkii]
MHFSTAIILSFLSVTALTTAYRTDNPSSLRLRDLEVRDLYQTDLYERDFDEDLSIRDVDDELFARDLYAEGFLHARSLYARGGLVSKLKPAPAQTPAQKAAHLAALQADLASVKSALNTMQTNPLQKPNQLEVNRLKMKLMNLQGEIMAVNGGEIVKSG